MYVQRTSNFSNKNDFKCLINYLLAKTKGKGQLKFKTPNLYFLQPLLAPLSLERDDIELVEHLHLRLRFD
jgi:hypothetical protein